MERNRTTTKKTSTRIKFAYFYFFYFFFLIFVLRDMETHMKMMYNVRVKVKPTLFLARLVLEQKEYIKSTTRIRYTNVYTILTLRKKGVSCGARFFFSGYAPASNHQTR